MDPKDVPDYSGGFYKHISLNRKRQIINKQLDDLHSMQLDMIDDAVGYSDLAQANDLIKYIKGL